MAHCPGLPVANVASAPALVPRTSAAVGPLVPTEDDDGKGQLAGPIRPSPFTCLDMRQIGDEATRISVMPASGYAKSLVAGD